MLGKLRRCGNPKGNEPVVVHSSNGILKLTGHDFMRHVHSHRELYRPPACRTCQINDEPLGRVHQYPWGRLWAGQENVIVGVGGLSRQADVS